MDSPPFRVCRYLYTWLSGRADLSVTEFEVDRGDGRMPVTLYAPRKAQGPVPAWIVLHGITRPGRSHPTLVRFVRSLAATGCAVAVPEIPEWRELRLAPEVTSPTVRATIAGLARRLDIPAGHLGLVGFSFGAPQALALAADPNVKDEIGGVIGFGGYCDLERTVRFGFTGEHEQAGHVRRLRPDPYGRWVIGANYLTHVPGYEDADEVATALWRLAALAGDRGIISWDERFDPVKEELRRPMSPAGREVFDLFAPPSAQDPPNGETREIAAALSEAGRRVDPGIDRTPVFGDVDRPVHIMHGRHDHLIPYTEGVRLGRALNPDALERSTVTPLFGHSTQDPFPGPVEGAKESAVFLKALAGMLALV